jgi:small conductance mechanosensitive channel
MKRLASDNNEESQSDLERRAETLGSVITTTGNVVIYAVILLMVLDIFKVDIRPILAGAGIVGLAVGFGAQSLVKDFVSGLFILIEDQYSDGDRVKIGGIEGEVLSISIRLTVLRGSQGQKIYFSNGYVATKEVENLSQANASGADTQTTAE